MFGVVTTENIEQALSNVLVLKLVIRVTIVLWVLLKWLILSINSNNYIVNTQYLMMLGVLYIENMFF